MATNNDYSSTRLLIRSFLPSLASIGGGLFASVLILTVHVLFFSLNYGSFVPALSSDETITTYTDFIVRPLESFFHNGLLNTLLTAVVWGVIGLVIYTALESGINAYNSWRNDETNVRIVDAKKVELHPLRRWLVTRMLWRLLISIMAVLLVVLVGSLTHTLLMNLDKALNGKSVWAIIEYVFLTVGVWTLLVHCFVVLLRLFMFRTRLTGEVIR